MKDPVTGIDADTQLLPEEYNEMLRIANRELDLESQIEEVLSEVKVNSITDKNDLIFYQIMVDERFKKVFSTARQMVLMDSQFSAQIQSRIADKAQQLKQLGLGAR